MALLAWLERGKAPLTGSSQCFSQAEELSQLSEPSQAGAEDLDESFAQSQTQSQNPSQPPGGDGDAPASPAGGVPTRQRSEGADRSVEREAKLRRLSRGGEWTRCAAPEGRWGAVWCSLGDGRALLFGGAGEGSASLGDVSLYDLRRGEWSRPVEFETDVRAWHSGVFVPKRRLLVVVGGEAGAASEGGARETLGDVTVLDTDLFVWYPPSLSGQGPGSRSGHASAMLSESVLVHGGCRGRTWVGDAYLLNLRTWHWERLEAGGEAPRPRSYHSATAIRGGGAVVFFGGNDAKDSFADVCVLERSPGGFRWFWPIVVGDAPSARTGHAAVLLPDGCVLVIGGWDPKCAEEKDDGIGRSAFRGDAALLDTESWEWRRPRSAPELCLAGHRALLLDCAAADGATVATVAVVGGVDPEGRMLSGVRVLRIEL